MASTATEKPKNRKQLAKLAGVGPISLVSILGGVLVAYATAALLLGGAAAFLRHRGSDIDLTKGWDKVGTSGGLVIGVALLLAYLLAGYMAGRMAWRRGLLHGIGVFVGSVVVVGVVAVLVRNLAKEKDVKAVTDSLRSFGVPTTRDEWRHVDSLVGVFSLAGMLIGSLAGGLLGERWYTRVSTRALVAEAPEVDVREHHTHSAPAATPANGNGNGNGHDKRPATADLDELNKEELYELAQENDIPGRSQMNKDELKKALQKQR
jgi:hypothetical protein